MKWEGWERKLGKPIIYTGEKWVLLESQEGQKIADEVGRGYVEAGLRFEENSKEEGVVS